MSCLKFSGGYWPWKTPEEGLREQLSKHCNYSNSDNDISVYNNDNSLSSIFKHK